MTGPIIFGDETARRQLVSQGDVVTFRESERTTGRTWWRESRTGTKRGDVTVVNLGKIRPYALQWLPSDVTDRSGFDTVDEWKSAIYDVHSCDPAAVGRLYRVVEGHRNPDDVNDVTIPPYALTPRLQK